MQFVERTTVLSESFLSKILVFTKLKVQNYEVYGYAEIRDINSDAIGIIHFSYPPLRSLWPLWLNHSDATRNDMNL